MARAANVTYRAGGFDGHPYIAVKKSGKYAYVGTYPKFNIQRIIMGVQDIEEGRGDVVKLLGTSDNELIARVYEMIHASTQKELAEMELDRKDVAMLATAAFYPESYEVSRSEKRIQEILDGLLGIGSIVSVLDARYWNREVVVADSQLMVPMPKTKDDIHSIWMLNDILKYGRRFPKRRPLR